MKKLAQLILLALAFTGMLVSCAEDAFIDYSSIKPKLVIQSRLSPDTSFQISITSSQSPIDQGQHIIPDDLAVSLINLSTGSVVNLYRENGLYVAPLTYPKAGESFKLFVTAPGFTTIETQTSIPQPVELENGRVLRLSVEESEVTPDKLNVTYDLFLNFKPHNHQYFHFSFIQTTTINVGSSTEPQLEERAYYMNPQFPDEDGFYQHHETGVLIDARQTGTAQSLTFSFVDYTLGDFEELGNLFIEVRTVTPEYYHYHTSLSRQLISRDDPFAEPIPVYNNIEDGLGNFSGFSRMWYQIPIIP